ncbi:MAG: DUF2461 domain-containing protein [Bacteroidaceae bacterium]|nr:DUF2461 domain-containing protein [Bacteroidaceae bacterium]
MKQIISFLEQLCGNNNREWFNAHKEEYLEAQAQFNAFVAKLITGIATFDPSIAGLDVKQCIYRIYRDTRFSSNKEPYKNYMAAYICCGGKSSGYAGYYFHIEPKEAGYIGHSLLAAGLYCPEKEALKNVREEIYTNGAGFLQAIAQAEGFKLQGNSSLMRVPAGYPKDSEYAEYLKLKDFSLMASLPEKVLLGKDLLEYAVLHFRQAKEFNDLLNRAINYRSQH